MQVALTTAILLAAWQILVSLTGLPIFILPGPWDVAQALVKYRALIWEHFQTTLIEVLAGIVLGTALGAYTAVSLYLMPGMRRIVQPFLVLSQAIPVFALAPILVVWLGYGITPKIVMTVLIIYFPVTSAFLDGLMAPRRGLEDLADVMGASALRRLWHLQIPAALPNLASGLRLAAVYAPIGAVIGEWVGSSAGLGYLMLYANGRSLTQLMFASLFCLALMTLVLYALIGVLARRLDRYAAGETQAQG
ncbi:MAG: ABC transporter permease [Pseudomonadota bacterium]